MFTQKWDQWRKSLALSAQTLTRRSFVVALLPLVLLIGGLAVPARGEATRDFTFFMSSDPHIGTQHKDGNRPITAQQWADRVSNRVKQIIATVGDPYPAIGPLKDLPPAKVALPLGFIIAGDVTDNGSDPSQWPLFETVFPAAGIDNGKIPLYLCAGNHDGPPAGPTRLGLIARNRQAEKEGRLGAIAANGLHYAWTWHGVHFVSVNLCPADTTDAQTPFKYGQPGPGSWNDPLGALTFLTTYLHDKVGNSGEPVIIWSHYGFCEGFNFDWNWWTPKQRRAFYDAIQGYNVVALLHGHTHAPAHYFWPDAKEDPKEVTRLFGDNPPANMRSYEVFSGGSVSAGTFYVFHVLGDKLIAAHRTPEGWSKNAEMYSVKSIADTPAKASTSSSAEHTNPAASPKAAGGAQMH